KVTVLTDRYMGKRYNQPNDLTVDSKGRIYFSDPQYGDRKGMEMLEKGGTVEGVYRIDPDGKETRVAGRQLERANGVLVSSGDRWRERMGRGELEAVEAVHGGRGRGVRLPYDLSAAGRVGRTEKGGPREGESGDPRRTPKPPSGRLWMDERSPE